MSYEQKHYLISLLILLTIIFTSSNLYGNHLAIVEKTDKCTYTPHPDEQNQYGYNYQLFTSFINDSEIAIGHLQVHPTGNKFTKNGTIEILIDGEEVALFLMPDFTDNAKGIVSYENNFTNDMHIYFETKFVNTDANIEIKQTEDSIPFIIFFNVQSTCSPCEDSFSITPILWSNQKNGNRERRLVNSGIVIRIPSQGAFNGAPESGPRQIEVLGPERCGNWIGESFANWITFTHPIPDSDGKISGSGNAIIEYTVSRNEEGHDRSSVIAFNTEDNRPIVTFPVFQEDKKLSQIWINELDAESPLYNPKLFDSQNGYFFINENQKVQLTIAAEWADGSVSIIDSGNQYVSWYIDTPLYAEIDQTGQLISRFIRGEPKILTVFVVYSYESNQVVSTRRVKNELRIVDVSQVQSLMIDGPRQINEGSRTDYKVIASLTNEDGLNISNDVNWNVSPSYLGGISGVHLKYINNNDAAYFGELKVKNVTSDSYITLTASYSYKGKTVSDSMKIIVQDTTKLERIFINGPSNVKDGKKEQFELRAYLSNEPASVITNGVTWLLDSSDYHYADISSNGLLSTVPENLGSTTRTITVSAQLNYSGEISDSASTRSTKKVSLNGPSNLELWIESEFSSLSEGETVFVDARFREENGFAQTITQDASWSVLPSDIAIIDKGILSLGYIESNSENIFVKVCYSHENQSLCEVKRFTVYDTTRLDKLAISGDTEIIEGHVGTFLATTSWTNTPDQDSTNEVLWQVTPSDSLQKISPGRFIALPVNSSKDIEITASYQHNDEYRADTFNVTIHPGIKLMEISGALSLNDNETAQYQAIVTWKDGNLVNVTDACDWEVEGPAKLDEAKPGLIIPQDIDGDKYITITASYAFGQDALLSKVNHRNILLKDAKPRTFTISGNISFDVMQFGFLKVYAYATSDSTCSKTFSSFETLLSPDANTQSYELTVPVIESFKIFAFIDVNNNGQKDECEAWGESENNEITEGHSQSNHFSLQPNPLCATAGAAIDLSMASQQYSNDNIYQDIDSQIIAQTGQDIHLGIVAFGVENLDTYQIEIVYDPNQIAYVKNSESEGSFLQKNDGQTIGFQMTEIKPGILNLVASLIGSDSHQAPDGTGLLANMAFKILPTSDSNDEIFLRLSNVYYINSCRLTEKIVNLSHALIVISNSPCELFKGDFNKDGIVNFQDLNLFADYWMFTEDALEWNPIYNLNNSPDIELNKQIINFKDLIAMMVNWLKLKPTHCIEKH